MKTRTSGVIRGEKFMMDRIPFRERGGLCRGRACMHADAVEHTVQ